MTTLGRILVLAGGVLLAGGRPARAGTASCLADAKANFLSCRNQCKSDFVDTRFTCRNVQPACGEACLAGRQECLDTVEGILKTGQLPDGGALANCGGGTDACKAALQAAKRQCGTPCQATDAQCNECVDNAQVVAFQCRNGCRDSWRTNATVIAMLQSCRNGFRTCVSACPRAS